MKRFAARTRSDAWFLLRARILTYAWGFLSILLALYFVRESYAQILWNKLMALCTNGVLALLVLALMPVRVDKWAAAAGVVVGYAAVFVMKETGMNFLLWPVIGNLLCFLVALGLSLRCGRRTISP